MKKQIIMRGLLGFPIGVAMGHIISILISIAVANGYYSPCHPALIDKLGSEINAVILQTILCGLLGSVFASASTIWEQENWSIAKQTGIYFFIISLTMLPIAYFSYWMEHSIIGFISYFGLFFSIFIIIWLTQYCIWKIRIKALNRLNNQTRNNI